jgi:long-chain fatty acid transport protein
MRNTLQQAVAAALLCTGIGQAMAAGFAIIEHGAQGMGNSFAGGGAVAEDASTVWFNPASMSRLDTQIQNSGHIIRPSFEFTNSGSVAAGSGAPLLSGRGGTVAAAPTNDGGKVAVVPNLYYIRKLNEQFSFGLAVNAPFGLATEYDSNWIGRYQAVESEIINLNVNPAVSYQVNNHLSMGAGVSINYLDAKLTNAIDFAGACFGRVSAGALGASAAAAAAAAAADCVGAAGGPGQGGNDGSAEVKGDDISFGFNLGLMYDFNDDSRVALAFRSEIKHELEGKATFGVPTLISRTAATDALIRGAFANDGVTAGVRLPASFSLSGYHRFNASKFAVMGDATWTGWSALPALLIVFDRPTTTGAGSSIEELGWRDAWRLGLGLNYYHNDHLTLRTGVAWDQSPVPNAVLRTARLPGNDRTWLSVGGSYRFNNSMSADFGYAHLFVGDSIINRTTATTGTLAGRYEADADIVSVQFNYQFH